MIENFKEIMEKVEKLMDENPNSHGFKIVEEEFKIIDKPVIAVKEEDNLSDIFTLRLEEDLDPDEYILKYGKDKFLDKINNPISVMDFKLNYLKKNKDLSQTVDKAKYANLFSL